MGAIRYGQESAVADFKKLNLLKLLAPIAADLKQVERMLVEQVGGFEPHMRAAVQYLLKGTGKRLRPALALLAGGATGGVTERHRVMGVVIELIHLATLVHDDVLDEAELRHGQPTAHACWGNTVSVLLGDCLFARALHLTATHTNTDICCRVSAAANTVCAGEILQNQRSFDLNLTRQQYLEMISMKTGALFALSGELGALLNETAAPVVQQLRDFGSQLGVAYQIYDDCVDLFGEERQTGKSLGTDMKKGKLTLPLLLLLEDADPERRAAMGEIIFRGSPSERRHLLQLALGNGMISESLLTIDRHLREARGKLLGLPDNTYARALHSLMDFIGYKTHTLMQEAAAG